MNTARLRADRARMHKDKPAVVLENTTYTYGELDREIARYAAVLDAVGVRTTDRIAIQLPKTIEFVFLESAILSVGAVTLPLNPDYQPDEIEYFLSDSRSRFFFTDRERFRRAAHVLRSLPGVRVLLTDDPDPAGSHAMPREPIHAGTRFERTYPAGGDDVATIIYTSGTTGRSKGAMLTHRNLISNMQALHETWEWSSDDILLHVLPLFHVHGLFVALHGALNAGATVIMHDRFDPSRTWETIERGKCTVLMGVPTMYQRLVTHWEGKDTKPDLRSMRLFISGSAPLPETLFNRFEEHTGYRILERYGTSETGMIASNSTDPAGRKAGSVGHALPGVQLRIVSAQGTDASPLEVGEVWVRGENVFKGYWGMPDKTSDSFRDGWFRTGDMGYVDREDGNRLYLVGRANDLIISGGYNVYPKEIENVLEGHPGVREAAVVGIPDHDFGERVTAAVVLTESAEVSADDLIRYCRERLAGYKCPKRAVFVDALPRNAMGKLRKDILLKRIS
ncbi:MAG: AMP-binding protein [Desulfomonilaceae bacterium]|nr:AMP-binding protein [Desulfomonilaceae bacterium]